MLRTWIGAIALLALGSAEAAAQAFIRGTLTDSLRGNAPIAGVDVELEGLDVVATTDRRGRFAFPRQEPGNYRVVFRGPRLDTLGIAQLAATARVTGRGVVDVALAIPGPGWFEQELCGGPLAAAGVLRGTVVDRRGDYRSGVEVIAVWDEPLLRGGELVMDTRTAVDTTDEVGTYTLCGVPIAGRGVLRAATGALRSGDIVFAPEGDAVIRRDLRIADATETSTVTGRVVGRRVRGAAVELWGDTLRSVETDADGRFRLGGIPRRSGQLYLRAIGQTPRLIAIDPLGPTLDIGEVTLEDLPVALQPMTIRERMLVRERLEFEERRKSGVGVFFDSTFLVSLPRVSARALAAESQLVRAGAQRSMAATVGEVVMLRSNTVQGVTSDCYPRVWLNGTPQSSQRPLRGGEGMITPDYMAQLLRTAKRIEVYQAAFAPAQFYDPDGCGALVIWTR